MAERSRSLLAAPCPSLVHVFPVRGNISIVMEQHFYDAATGKESGKKDDSGSLRKRLEALEAKIRAMAGVPKPTPTPTPQPKMNKRMGDRTINPDTGEAAKPGEPTVYHDAAPPSPGSQSSYHYDGIKPTMKEFKAGNLHSGSKNGPKVKNRKQAIAIGLSEER
jgi:hypothetical protein